MLTIMLYPDFHAHFTTEMSDRHGIAISCGRTWLYWCV